MSQLLVTRIFIVLSLASAMELETLGIRKELSIQNEKETCDKLSKHPYFEPEMVIGGTWKIFYGWKLPHEHGGSIKCFDMEFTKATPEIVKRFQNDMYEYVEAQPTWDAATLLMIIGSAKHEMLLFADQGPAGKFVGIPNLMQDSNIAPVKKSVPLMDIQFKLLGQGRYLLITDCLMGVTTLGARNKEIKPSVIKDLVSTLDLGEGSYVCTDNKDPFLANRFQTA